MKKSDGLDWSNCLWAQILQDYRIARSEFCSDFAAGDGVFGLIL